MTKPAQEQDQQPGRQHKMKPPPQGEARSYKAAEKLSGKTALITGGDSGIGRAVAVMFAKEGADVAFIFYNEGEDAARTQELIEETGSDCMAINGDVGNSEFCRNAVEEVVERYGRIDVLVNNAAEQHVQERLEDITDEQLHQTFRTNIFAYFYLTRAALPHMNEGATIINTTSVTAYKGSNHLIDYASTKGAIVAFTRSMAKSLSERKIRVNAVAPGPVWTPLIPASFDEDHVAEFGAKTPFSRPGEPDEIGPSYVFLASNDSSYMTGQVLHPNGGMAVSS